MAEYILPFSEIDMARQEEVGGKNASLGEMFTKLSEKGIEVPDGYATTADAYWYFIKSNDLSEAISNEIEKLDREGFSNLRQVGKNIREKVLVAEIPENLQEEIIAGFKELKEREGKDIQVAVRSSATAEDLPAASFAGQLETYLNISNEDQLIDACLKCYASLFTDRSIKYREDNDFDHMEVALSIGIQRMVRADKGCAGVSFTLEPETGFREVVVINGGWGLGENVVQGKIDPDEFVVFKHALKNGKKAIISKKLGNKQQTMIYAPSDEEGDTTENTDTPDEKRDEFILNEEEVNQLARWSVMIEEHYDKPMDIEWAKDGKNEELFILQARPETVHAVKKDPHKITTYQLKEKGKVLVKGTSIGGKIASGKARILHSPEESDKLEEGEVLVTEVTNPDWDPILQKAAAIVTNKGGRTSHAAIVAREIGAVAVVGTGNATEKIKDGQEVTVSCVEGSEGYIYEGKLEWEESEVDTQQMKIPETEVMLILGDPGQAFRLSFLPANGIGLMRMEFVINNAIRIHPMALVKLEEVEDEDEKKEIKQLTRHYANKEDYFVDKLSQAIATIAAAFYPRDVIVRMSDFKTNEYANLIGGKHFEPEEGNPMLGLRGASRYYSNLYKDGFELECKAMKVVRDKMGLDNVKLMIPFCRTVEEGKKVVEIMEDFGLKRGSNGLEIYVMIEIPANVVLAGQLAEVFDGFSIGSNDLTQLTLGLDRDSELVSQLFDEMNPAVTELTSRVIGSAKSTGTKIGLCGQGPSDNPDFARFLVEQGIDSISLNPDALLKGIENINAAEEKLLVHQNNNYR